MTLQGKLVTNALVTMIGILLIGAASLLAFHYVEKSIREVTDSSTPYQLRTLEFTKSLQEHAASLLEVASASELSGVFRKEADLDRGLTELKRLSSQIQLLRKSMPLAESGQTLSTVEGLTRDILTTARMRIDAETRAAASVKEAHKTLERFVAGRRMFQNSLERLQRETAESLMRSTSRSKGMTEAFRTLERIKDLFQGLETAYRDIEKAEEPAEVDIARGRLLYALEEIKGSSKAFTTITIAAHSLQEFLTSPNGPLLLKITHLQNRTDEARKDFERSIRIGSGHLEHLARVIVENTEDATAAFYAENIQLEQNLAGSESVSRVMMLNTQMTTAVDAIQYWVQNLFAERDRKKIEAIRGTVKDSFQLSREIKGSMERVLEAMGQGSERKAMKESSSALDRVEEVVLQPGGMIENLRKAADAREKSAQLALRLSGMIRAEKEAGDRSIAEARGRQQLSVRFVNFIMKAATILLIAVISFVLAVTAVFVWRIARSIVVLVKDLLTAKEGAEAASRAKSQFLANISHEIRTPMNGVLGLLELLKTSPLSKKQGNYVNLALSSGVALLNVINDVLDFSKIEAGQMALNNEDFDLRESIEEAVSFLIERAEAKKIELICHILPDVPKHVRGDVVRLRQVLINLLGNAVKFTESGEVVTRVSLDAEREGSLSLRFEVTDTGIGIPPEAQTKIFDSFSQADASTTRKFGGTGLGLSIAKQLVHMMNGEIGVISEVGKGSCFWFTAKVGRGLDKTATEQAEGKKASYEALTGLKVLVVDDNSTNRQILHDMLVAWGLIPTVVSSGKEALAVLADGRTDTHFAIAILDMMMPGMDGMELARAIRTDPDYGRMPLIMLTSLDGKGELESSRENGISLHLVKPVRQSQLLNALESVLGISAGQKRPTISPTESLLPQKLSVLLVEDYAVNQTVGTAMLEFLGCTVDLAANGRIAIDLYSRNTYDVILMDCQMPEMDGYEATRAIRKIEEEKGGKRLPIIALTAHALEGDREKSLAAGMDDHLNKPFTLEQLRAVLLKHSSGKEGIENTVPPESRVGPGMDAPLFPLDNASGFDGSALERIRQIDADGSQGLVRIVVTRYLAEAPATIESLKEAVQGNDAPRIQKLAHGFKSTSANVGAVSLAEFCKQMEAAGRTGETAPATGLLVSIESEYARIRTTLENRL